MKLFLALFTLIMGVSNQSHAIFEGRLTYTLLASKPDLGALYTGSTSVPSAAANYGIGGDALFFIPLTGYGAGLRYEDLGATASANGLEFASVAKRTSILLTYRFINTFLHLGPIFSYGISHTNSMKVTDKNNAALGANWEPGSTKSYQIGLDVGFGLVGFVVGGELGYQSMMWEKMKDLKGVSTKTPDTDMSGTYAKVYVGIGI
jgi:hypothetical protein